MNKWLNEKKSREEAGFGMGMYETKGGRPRIWRDFKKIRSFGELKDFVSNHSDRLRLLIFPVLAVIIIFSVLLGGDAGGVKVADMGEATGQEQNYSGEYGDDAVGTAGGVSSELGSDSDYASGSASSADDKSSASQKSISGGVIYVDISGEVVRPGVYELSKGTRLFQLIERAGGLTVDANRNMINQATTVSDGQKIIIRSYEETKGMSYGDGGGSIYDGQTSGAGTSDSSDTKGGKININTASAAKLQEIPGIGPTKADSIIAYRKAHGSFKKIEDIKNVDGIGNYTYQSIEEYITV